MLERVPVIQRCATFACTRRTILTFACACKHLPTLHTHATAFDMCVYTHKVALLLLILHAHESEVSFFLLYCVGTIKTSEIVLTTIDPDSKCCIGCSDFFIAASGVTFGDHHLSCAHTLAAHHIHNQLLSNDGDQEPFVTWILAQQQQGNRVIKLSKSARATPRYGVALLKDEALQANCSRVGVCSIFKDNHQITVRCWSTQCKHSHRLLVTHEADMCPHAKLTLAYIHENDVDALADVEHHDSETDTKRSKTAGVWFDSIQARWRPDENCSQVQIPYEPNEEAKRWFKRRLTMDDVKRSHNGSPTKDAMGCYEGDPCIALQCSACDAKIADIREEVDVQPLKASIVIHTLSGPIAREKFGWECTCGQRNLWDPSTEFIHTIRNGAEGGLSHFLRAHATLTRISCMRMQVCSYFACERKNSLPSRI